MSTTADRPEAAAPTAEAPLAPLAKGLPILGNTFGFLRDTTALLLRSYREHGPVYRLRALWLKYTVIGGFEARDFIRQGLDDQYLSREEVFREVGVQLGAADFVLGQSGEKHMRFRKLLSVAYSREVGSRWVPEFIGAVRERARAWTPGSIVGVMEEVSSIAFEQYCRAMCGRSLRAHYRDCLRVTDYNMNVGGRVWPFFMYKMPWYRASRQRVLDLMWGMVRERKAAGRRPGERGTILGTLMAIRDSQGEPLTDDEVVCYSMYGFAGSCSYMSRVIGFLLYELLQRPELLAQVTAEVDAAFAEGLENAADVRRLTLLQAVYHETLRFHPVSQGMPHVAARDFVYLGKKVQKGEVTVLSQVPMSFSKCPFHQPEKFEPERCLAPRSEHRQENAFHPFGIGHRTCTATGLVELMTLTMVATLLHELRFTASPADYQLRLKVKPLPAPDDAFKLRIEAHRTAADRATAPRAADEEEVLATFPGHDEPAVAEALQRAAQRTFASGEVILREGEPAEAFFIIAGGRAEVTRAVHGAPQALAVLGEGQFFGEIGLLQNIPRTATVTAGPDGVEVLELSRLDFLELVAQSDFVSQDMARLLQKRLALQRLVEALPRLGVAHAERLLPDFHPQTFSAGAVIVREGDVAEHFYVLVEGEVHVTRAGAPLAILRPGAYFGEAGLLSGAPRNATVTVAPSAPASVLVADKTAFEKMIHGAGGRRGNLALAMLGQLG